MVSIPSLLNNHVPSETIQRIPLPPSPMSPGSSHFMSCTSPKGVASSISTRPNVASSTLNRLVHNSSIHLANGYLPGQTSGLTTTSHFNNLSNTSNSCSGVQGQIKKPKMSKDGAVFIKGKIKGEVNFPPWEDLDEPTRAEVNKFHVFPLGKIKDYCRHIPYNSEKKAFSEKTGRESFEVFQYTFRLPNSSDNDKVYTVMWDYNTGLVRITPFFKCCNFSKTTPAKMLSVNPGLKEITHSITGGALVAQGYWMPYACALAVCATFCYNIAPALIPIFGPDFPSHCLPPDAPDYSKFSIPPEIVAKCTREAEEFRLIYSTPPHVSRRSEARMLSPRSTPTDMILSDFRDRELRDLSRERERLEMRMEQERDVDGHRAYQYDSGLRTPLPTPYMSKRFPATSRPPFSRTGSPYGSGSTDGDMEYNTDSSNDRYLCSPYTPASEKSVINSGGHGSHLFDRPYNQSLTPPRLLLPEHHHRELPSPELSAVPGSHHSLIHTILQPIVVTTPHQYFAQSHHRHSPSSFSLNTINRAFQPPPPPSNSTASSPELKRDNLPSKRRITELDDTNDDGYEAEQEESGSSGSGSDKGAAVASTGGNRASDTNEAAGILMKLSMEDGLGSNNSLSASSRDVGLGIQGPRMSGLMVGGGDGSSDFDGHRSKRRKALSA